jgi:uncharacterized protein YoxC
MKFAMVAIGQLVIVCFNIISTKRVKLNLDILISWVKGITEMITELKSMLVDCMQPKSAGFDSVCCRLHRVDI